MAKVKSITALRKTIEQVELEAPKDDSELGKIYKLVKQDLKRAMLTLTGYVDPKKQPKDH